jgi:hypothetical protein
MPELVFDKKSFSFQIIFSIPGMQYLDMMLLMISLALVHLLFCRILQKIRRKMMHPRCKSQVIMGCFFNPLLARLPRPIRLHQRRL